MEDVRQTVGHKNECDKSFIISQRPALMASVDAANCEGMNQMKMEQAHKGRTSSGSIKWSSWSVEQEKTPAANQLYLVEPTGVEI